jgi:hypothetical protein
MTEAKNAELIYQGSLSGAAIVIGDHEEGKTIHWNMGDHWAGTNIWTDEVKQLFTNIVTYSLSVSK